MLSKTIKKLNLWAGLATLLVVASFVGCSSALENDIPGGAGTGGLLASVQKVGAYPASLAVTDWGGPASTSEDARYVVFSFTEASVLKTPAVGNIAVESGTGFLLLSSSDAPVPFDYSYNPVSGIGEILNTTGWDGSIVADVSGTTMTFTASEFNQVYELTLIIPTLKTMDGTVWNTITPRDIYSSLDFTVNSLPDPGAPIGEVQTTFGDGTFPLYDFVYYDGISAGLIQTMGLFYLTTDDANGALKVVFPDFYRYHMGVDVIYTPSEKVLCSVDNTVWATAKGDETVTFEKDEAVFSGYDNFTAPYLYNGKQAGAAGVPPGTANDAGSFLVADDGVNPPTLTFFNYKSRVNPPAPLVFYKQAQP